MKLRETLWLIAFALYVLASSSLISLAAHYAICGSLTLGTIALTAAALMAGKAYKFFNETFQ